MVWKHERQKKNMEPWSNGRDFLLDPLPGMETRKTKKKHGTLEQRPRFSP